MFSFDVDTDILTKELLRKAISTLEKPKQDRGCCHCGKPAGKNFHTIYGVLFCDVCFKEAQKIVKGTGGWLESLFEPSKTIG